MNRSFLFKVLGILFLIILMAWALSYVNELILERKMRQEQVTQQVASSSAGFQTVIGPILVVPYTETFTETILLADNKTQRAITRKVDGKFYVLPEDLTLSGGFSNQYKSLSIYQVLMYQLGGTVSGSFNISKNLKIKSAHTDSIITLHDAYLSIGLSDPRGISGSPILKWNKQSIEVAQSSSVTAIGSGIHASVGALDATTTQNIPFELTINLRGMGKFDFVPIANNNAVDLSGKWQHPHFDGSFLPDSSTQQIDKNGFKAHWAVSSLASNIQEKLLTGLKTNTPQTFESLSIGFVEPINIYSQADRATKYGLLFIGLTFAGFFVFEILKQLRIHPAQYTLVGLAMALFYLLLVSLSEHISFVRSYIAASTACVSLLGYYLSHVLRSKAHGLVFGIMLTALYGALYGILASEDNAMLMGSLLVFGLLALTMIVTRKIDWYQIGNVQGS